MIKLGTLIFLVYFKLKIFLKLMNPLNYPLKSSFRKTFGNLSMLIYSDRLKEINELKLKDEERCTGLEDGVLAR